MVLGSPISLDAAILAFLFSCTFSYSGVPLVLARPRFLLRSMAPGLSLSIASMFFKGFCFIPAVFGASNFGLNADWPRNRNFGFGKRGLLEKGSFQNTVRAEIITELNLERAGPVIFKTFLLKIMAFRRIPVISCKKRKAWKWLEMIINSRRGLSRNKISKFWEINSRKHISGSAINLVPTVVPFLEILENSEILEFLENPPPDCGKQRGFPPFARDSREIRDFRDSRDLSSQKTPFAMTPFSVPRSRKLPETFWGFKFGTPNKTEWIHRVLQGAAQRGAQFDFIFVVLWTRFSCKKKEPFLP